MPAATSKSLDGRNIFLKPQMNRTPGALFSKPGSPCFGCYWGLKPGTLYHWATHPFHFNLIKGLAVARGGLKHAVSLLASDSWVAGIRGTKHCTQHSLFFIYLDSKTIDVKIFLMHIWQNHILWLYYRLWWIIIKLNKILQYLLDEIDRVFQNIYPYNYIMLENTEFKVINF